MWIPAMLRSDIYKQLLGEVKENARTFDVRPDAAVSATVYHGSLANLLTDPELVWLNPPPSELRRAVINHCTDPADFLRRAAADLAALEQDPEFEPLRRTPSVFRTAVFEHRKDPRLYLRQQMNAGVKAPESEGGESRWADSVDAENRCKERDRPGKSL